MVKNVILIFTALILVSSFLNPLYSYNYPDWTKAQRYLFGDLKKMEEALPFYIKLAEKNKNDYTAQWKVAELCYYLWENYRFGGNLAGQWKAAKNGYYYGWKGVLLNPNGIEGLFWYAADKGVWGILNGPLNSLKEAVKVKKYLFRLKSLDPQAKFEKGSWARILGKVYVFSPPFPVGFGDVTEGIRILTFAVEKYPDYGINRNFLAESYMAIGKIDVAEKLLKKNVEILKKADQTIYVNRRDLRIARNLLLLIREYKGKKENRVPASVILEAEYR